jgi:Tfp pilus assembly protein PilV
MAPKPLADGKETRYQSGAAQSWLAQMQRISFGQQPWRQDKRRLPAMELFSEPGGEVDR